MRKKFIISSAILIFLTLISKLLVVVRDVAMAYYYGSSVNSDAYITAVAILSLISSAVLGTIMVSFIPIISGKSDEEISDITNNITMVVSVFVVIISVIALFFTDYLVKIFASGFNQETVKLSSIILKITLPFIFANVVLNICIAFLQYKNKFLFQGISAILSAVIMIVSIVVSNKNIYLTAVGYVVSLIIPAVIGIFLTVKSGLKIKPSFKLKDESLKELIKMGIPIFISQIFIQLNIIVDKNFSSQIGVGILTNLDYAHKISTLLVTAFVIPVSFILFPSMSKTAAQTDTKEYKSILSTGIKYVSMLTVPMTVGVMLLSQPIINVFFLRGEFTPEAAVVTAKALFWYALTITPLGYIYILNNAFYSFKDAKTPLICGTGPLLLNVLLNYILIKFLSYSGLAIATSISTAVNAIIYFLVLRKKIGAYGLKKIVLQFLKILASSIIMGIVVFLIKDGFINFAGENTLYMLMVLIAIAIIGALVYYISGVIFKIDEMLAIKNIVACKIKQLIKH